MSGNLHSQYPLYVDVDDAMKTLWFVGVVDVAHLHEQRMHTTPAMKAWLEALVETSWQFGYTSAKVPPDARISDLMMAMLAFGQQKYALRAASMPEKVAPGFLFFLGKGPSGARFSLKKKRPPSPFRPRASRACATARPRARPRPRPC